MNKKNVYMWLVISLLLVISITMTYAYFSVMFESNESENVVETGTLSIKFVDGKEIVSNDMYPGEYVVKTFTVENTGTLDTNYSISIINLINTFVNDELVYELDRGEETYNGIVPVEEGSDLWKNVYIASGEVHEYTLTITFVEKNENQNYNQGKEFSGVLQINENASSDIKLSLLLNGKGISVLPENGFYTLDNYECKNGSIIKWNIMSGTTTTITKGRNDSCTLEFSDVSESTLLGKMVNAEEVYADNVNSTYVQNDTPGIIHGLVPSETNGRGLYYTTDSTKTEDVNGDGLGERVLFYRGAVENNYVIFAGYCWRIIRTNENDSIRLRFGGTPTSGVCPQTGTAVNIGQSVFNSTKNAYKYFQYVYDGSTNSTIKGVVDSWYSSNMASKEVVKNYVVDAPYCQDLTGSASGTTNGTTSATLYGASNRLYDSNMTYKGADAQLQYKCPNNEHNYSVTFENGNGKLTYPIALMTIDELLYAGSRNSYISTSAIYYLLSPAMYTTYAVHFGHHGDDYITWMSTSQDVVPVLSIKIDSPVTGGTGSYDSPYVIE